MKRTMASVLAGLMLVILTGCAAPGVAGIPESSAAPADSTIGTPVPDVVSLNLTDVTPTEHIVELESGLSAAAFTGDDGFERFLAQGGASSDREVAEFLTQNLTLGLDGITFKTADFGCSAIAAQTATGGRLFGRNFDWYNCEARIVKAAPANGYASVSTVNMDFLGSVGNVLKLLPDTADIIASLYAPLDGMNEKGLCVAVLLIQDRAAIDQNTDKPDITTTTAVRLLLNKAASVEEALALLSEHDMHGSMGMMVHFAIADATGKSVVVEYIDNEMIVTDTPVVTNFYLAEGEKNGIGTQQSHTRYEQLMQLLTNQEALDAADVRDALNGVSKHNYNDGETTEWSIVFDQTNGEIHYYHRENYEQGYRFTVS